MGGSFKTGSVVLVIAVVATGLAMPVNSQPVTPISTGFGPGGEARAVAQAVGGIISYTRWPTVQPVLRLCVSGVTRYSARFSEVAVVAGRAVTARPIAAGSSTVNCDVLYLGDMAPAVRLAMTRAVHARPVLSIAEADPPCRGGAMVCLRVRASSLGLQLNLDAVSRSAVQVDPRVLIVAGGGDA